jgi:very-short-patch-repair endonuclease
MSTARPRSAPDITRHQGVAVTTPARTLLDSAPRLSDKALTRTVNDAFLSRYLHDAALAEIVDRHPRHHGARRLRRFVAPSTGPTRSQLEDEFLNFCQRYQLPQPEMNVLVAGYLVDALFRAEGLIVELDGYEFHSGHASFERDRNRDADTLLAGLPTVRITWARMTSSAPREADRLAAILEQRRR